MEWNTEKLLSDIYDAAQQKNALLKIEALITNSPTPPNVEDALNTLNESAWRKVLQRKRQQRQRKKRWQAAFIIIGVIVITVVILGLVGLGIYRANPDRYQQWWYGTCTPTVTLTPLPTAIPTSTPTLTSTPTQTPTPTPIPPSSFLVTDPATISPAIPASADLAWVIDDTQVLAEPAFDDANVWSAYTSPDPDVQEVSYHFTTSGNATITWYMDVPLDTGLYGLYIVDTLENSVGEQPFTVKLDDTPVEPYRGQSTVIFGDENEQSTDDWLPLGFYEVKRGQEMSVQFAIGPRSEEAPFSIDRLLLLKIPETQRLIIDALPKRRPLVSLLDDNRASFVAAYNAKTLKEEYQGVVQASALAWHVRFRSLDLTGEKWNNQVIGNKIWVDWQSLGRLAAGQYELYVWVPAQHATAIVDFALLVNGAVVERPNPAPLNQRDHNDNWVSLGTWELPEESAVSVRMIVVRADQVPETAEIGVDAVALVKIKE